MKWKIALTYGCVSAFLGADKNKQLQLESLGHGL